MLVRILAGDLYKMKILGFDRLPSESMFSRFKERIDIDRVMQILTGMIRNLDQDFMCMVGVDSTSLKAFSMTDQDAAWGYDHITEEMYYGYKIHLLYDLLNLAPICSVVTPANIHDTTQLLPLLRKMGARILLINGLFADIAYDSKEHLDLKRVNTTRMFRVTIKTGLTLIARQIQVLYQKRQGANPRTTIIE
jgi:hypothetical protein